MFLSLYDKVIIPAHIILQCMQLGKEILIAVILWVLPFPLAPYTWPVRKLDQRLVAAAESGAKKYICLRSRERCPRLQNASSPFFPFANIQRWFLGEGRMACAAAAGAFEECAAVSARIFCQVDIGSRCLAWLQCNWNYLLLLPSFCVWAEILENLDHAFKGMHANYFAR